MKFIQFNMPVMDNDGKERECVHRRFRERLAANFGGFTLSSGFGYWVSDSGEEFKEEVLIYSVALDEEREQELRALVEAYGREMDQLAVFLAETGNASIVSLA